MRGAAAGLRAIGLKFDVKTSAPYKLFLDEKTDLQLVFAPGNRRINEVSVEYLLRDMMQKTVASGKDILFVGTKRQARHAVEEEAARCGMHYVSERWLGGTLTNFRTIHTSIERLKKLDAAKIRP
jgi:hypothetical protein